MRRGPAASERPPAPFTLSLPKVALDNLIEELWPVYDLPGSPLSKDANFVALMMHVYSQEPDTVIVDPYADRRVTVVLMAAVRASGEEASIMRPLYTNYDRTLRLMALAYHSCVILAQAVSTQSYSLSYDDLFAYRLSLDSLKYVDDVSAANDSDVIDGPMELRGHVRSITHTTYGQRIQLQQVANPTLAENLSGITLSSNSTVTGSDTDMVKTEADEKSHYVQRKRAELSRLQAMALSRKLIDCEIPLSESMKFRVGELVTVIGKLTIEQMSRQSRTKKTKVTHEVLDLACSYRSGGSDSGADGGESVSGGEPLLLVDHVIPHPRLLTGEYIINPAMTAVTDTIQQCVSEGSDFYSELVNHRLHASLPSVVDESLNAALLLAVVGGDNLTLPSPIIAPYHHTLLVCDRCDEARHISSRILSSLVMIVSKGMYVDVGPRAVVPMVPLFPILDFSDRGSVNVSDSGALTMCDGGTCFIDNVDCLPLDSLAALTLAMLTGAVTITKCSPSDGESLTVKSFDARTAIVAACSTIEPQYNRGSTLAENVDLPQSLLDQFSLIYSVGSQSCSDVSVSQTFARVVRWERAGEGAKRVRLASSNDIREDHEYQCPLLTSQQLTTYISAAQIAVHPALSADSDEWDQLMYCATSEQLTSSGIETLVKLCQARAKLDQSADITVDHINDASRVFSRNLQRNNAIDETLVDSITASNTAPTFKVNRAIVDRVWRAMTSCMRNRADSDNSAMSREEFMTIARGLRVPIDDNIVYDQLVARLKERSLGKFLDASGGFTVLINK